MLRFVLTMEANSLLTASWEGSAYFVAKFQGSSARLPIMIY